MSLSRILNDEPPSSLPSGPAQPAPLPLPPIDPALIEMSRRSSPISSTYAHQPHGGPHDFPDRSPTPQGIYDGHRASLSPPPWAGSLGSAEGVHAASMQRAGSVDHPPHPRGLTYQPLEYQGAGGWNPYTGEWTPGDIFPLGPGENYYPEQDSRLATASNRHQTRPPGGYYKEDYATENTGGRGRKRRKTNDDAEYQPTRRVC